MTGQILHYHYGIFCCWVAEVLPCEMSPSGDEQGEMYVLTFVCYEYTVMGYQEKPHTNF